MFVGKYWERYITEVKMRKIKSNKRIIEEYKGQNGVLWVRLKYLDKHRTEVAMQENEFERIYGKIA